MDDDKVLIKVQTLKNIANQIRYDLEEDYEYTASMMPDRIHSVYEKGFADGGKDQWRAYCLKTPESHFDLPVGMVTLSTELFNGHLGVKSVSMPNTITIIKEDAFAQSSIQNIKLSDSLQLIYEYAFSNSPIRIRQFPESLEGIYEDAFYNCPNMDVIILSPSIKEIGENAFWGCRNLTEVTFVKTAIESGKPDYLGYIDDYDDWAYVPFENCPNLRTINVPWGPDDPINECAPWGASKATINYSYWDSIPEVFHFPKGFEKIPDYLFNDSEMGTSLIPKVKEIYIGDECKEIGCYAFTKSPNLSKVHLPDGLVIVGTHAFSGCSNLTITELPDSIEILNDSAFAKVSMSLKKLPKKLKEISARSLATTGGLASKNNNRFTEIPKDVRFIHSNAFQHNRRLTKLTFLGTPEVIRDNVFDGCVNLTELNVPWAKGEVAGAPWGADNATINYNWRNG